MIETIESTCPVKYVAKKQWIDDKCWKLIIERRELRQKKAHSAEHRAASLRAKNALRNAKREWYRERLK